MEDYRAGLHAVAARTLRQLIEDGSRKPAHLSWCGLLEAMTEHKYDESVALCRSAVEQEGVRTPELFYNLARVLTLGGRRREAVEVLARATSIHPRDPRLRIELQHLLPRAKPFFRALPRKHPLNKYAGIARTVGGRLWVTFVPRVRRVTPPH
jgi:predicted Zn-dependent protease